MAPSSSSSSSSSLLSPLFVTASPASSVTWTTFPRSGGVISPSYSTSTRCTQRYTLRSSRRHGHHAGLSGSAYSEWISSPGSLRAVSLRDSEGYDEKRRRGRGGERESYNDDGMWTISNVIVPSDGYPKGHGQGSNNYDAFSPLKSTIETSFGKVLDELDNVMEGGPTFSRCRDFVTLLLYLKWCNVPAYKIIDLLLLTSTQHRPCYDDDDYYSTGTKDFVQPMIHHIYAVDSFCMSRERKLQDGAVASWVRGRVVGQRPIHAFSRSQMKRYNAMYRTVYDELPATVSWSLLFFNKLTQAAAAQRDVGEERMQRNVVSSDGDDDGVDSAAKMRGRRRRSRKRGSCLPRTWEDLLAYIVLSCRYTLNT